MAIDRRRRDEVNIGYPERWLYASWINAKAIRS